MWTEQLTSLEAEGEVVRLLNRFKLPVIFYNTDQSKVIVLFGSLCLLVLVSVSTLFSHSLYLDDIWLGLGSVSACL